MDSEELLQLLRKAALLSRRPPEGPERPPFGELPPFGAVPLREPVRPEGRFAPPMPGRPPHRERERVLSLLSESEGLSQRKLALILDIRPQSLSELLGKLERDGLIERRKNDGDKRETLVSLTEAGRLRAQAFEDAREDAVERFLAPLGAEERETLGGLLEKLVFHAEEATEI